MVKTVLFLGGLVIVIGLILAAPLITGLRRKRLRDRSFPASWQLMLDRHIPFYEQLPAPLPQRLRGDIQVFLAEKRFVGCGGLSLTDEMRVTIAAQACLLIVNQTDRFYPKLNAIYVYPAAFLVNTKQAIDGYVLEEKVARRGESWEQGIVVLSWADIQHDLAHWQDGHNVVLHEFAHQLDQEDGRADGVPILANVDRPRWAQIFGQAYQTLQREVERGAKTVLDEYGATDPAEFFAVATETFFEKAKPLQRHHPELYEALRHYYRLDPVTWVQPR